MLSTLCIFRQVFSIAECVHAYDARMYPCVYKCIDMHKQRKHAWCTYMRIIFPSANKKEIYVPFIFPWRHFCVLSTYVHTVAQNTHLFKVQLGEMSLMPQGIAVMQCHPAWRNLLSSVIEPTMQCWKCSLTGNSMCFNSKVPSRSTL